MTEPSAPDRFALAFGVCTAVALVLLGSVAYLPMVDLPQHAAQVTLWKLLAEPGSGYAETYDWNPFTPYLLVYAAGRLLAAVLPVALAMKLVVALVVLALPVSLLVLLRRTGGDRWWALLGFPLAFSFDFYWGLLSFMAAVPPALVLIAWAFPFARRPTPARGLGLALLGLVLLLTHGLVCGFALLAAGAVILAHAGSPPRALLGQLPLLPTAAAGLAWFFATRSSEAQASRPPAWNLDPLRLLDLPGTLLGHAADPQARLFGIGLILLTAWGLARGGGRPWARWIPLLLAAGVFLLGPEIYFHAAFLNSRFAVFVLPFALFALGPRRADRWQRLLLAALALSWMLSLLPRFHDFDREARRFDDLLAVMAPEKRVLGLNFDPFPDAVWAPAFLHHHAWYQAEKGGVADFSFAYFYVQLVRYRPEVTPRIPDFFALQPETFDWRRHGAYDYFVVRADVDKGRELFRRTTAPVRLRLRSGDWWLYERGTPHPPPGGNAR